MKFPIAATVLVAALAGAALARAEPIPLRTFEVILSHDDPADDTVGQLKYRGGLDLRSTDSRFGGLSGLDISADGRRLVAVSDRGNWFTAGLTYSPEGRLQDVVDPQLLPILDGDGKPLTGRKLTDSESIVRLTDGSLVVGFEQTHRLRRYAHPAAPGAAIGAPAVLSAAPRNGGAEAVTRLWGNELLVLSERLEARPGIAAGWIGSAKKWRAVGYRRTGIFRPVGAATRDDGVVFVLERRFTTIGGIASLVSRVQPPQIAPGAIIKATPLAELAPPLVADNFEGISVRRGKQEETLIYIVSDDNFHDLQRTLLLMFSLAEPSP